MSPSSSPRPRDGLGAYGIKVPTVELDLGAMQDHKAKVVKELTQGIEFLLRKNKVASIKGTARLDGPGRVQVALTDGGEQQLAAKHVVIATGSESTPLPGDRDRREADRVLDRRARPGRGARRIWWWSAPATSAWSWARSGVASAPR